MTEDVTEDTSDDISDESTAATADSVAGDIDTESASESVPSTPVAPPSFTRRNSTVIVVIAALVALVVAFAVVARTAGDDSGDSAGSSGTTTPFFGARDDFDRPDSAKSMGAAPDGQTWIPVNGVWGIEDNEAYVATARSRGYNTAVVNMRSGTGSVHVTMPRVVRGAGLVFRYRNAFNFWMVTASPNVATWVVQKVVSGDVTSLGGIGLAPVADGTTIGVDIDELGFTVSVDGRAQKSFLDTDLQGEPRVGLVGYRKSSEKARWSDFVAAGQEPTPGAPVTSAPLTTPEPQFAPGADAPPPPALEEPTTEPEAPPAT